MTVVLALTLAALLVVGAAARYLHEWLAVGPRLEAAKASLFQEGRT